MFTRDGIRCGIICAALFALLPLASGCGAKHVGPVQPQAGQAVTTSPYAALRENHAKQNLREQAKYLRSISNTARANRFRQDDEESDLFLSAETRALATRAEREPNNPDVQKQFARALIQEKKLVRAFETLERLRTIPPRDVEVESGLAVVWEKLGSMSPALYHAQQAVLLERSAANLALLGRIQLQRGDYGRALEAFEESLPAFPDSQALKLSMAQACSGLSRWDQAAPYYAQVLKTNPAQKEARIGYATTLVYLGKTQEALAQLRQIFPVGEAYEQLAHRQMEAHLWEGARESLLEALRFSPGDSELMLKLSSVESRLPLPSVVSIRRKEGSGSRVLVVPSPSYRLIEGEGGQLVVQRVATGGIRTGASAGSSDSVGPSPDSPDVATSESGVFDGLTMGQLVQRRIDPTVVELVDPSSPARSVETGSPEPEEAGGEQVAEVSGGAAGASPSAQLQAGMQPENTESWSPSESKWLLGEGHGYGVDQPEGTPDELGFVPLPDAAVFVSKEGVFPLEMPSPETTSEVEGPPVETRAAEPNDAPETPDSGSKPQVVQVFSAAWKEEYVPAGAGAAIPPNQEIPAAAAMLAGQWPKAPVKSGSGGNGKDSAGQKGIPAVIPQNLPRRGVGEIELKLALPELTPGPVPAHSGRPPKGAAERVIGARFQEFPPVC